MIHPITVLLSVLYSIHHMFLAWAITTAEFGSDYPQYNAFKMHVGFWPHEEFYEARMWKSSNKKIRRKRACRLPLRTLPLSYTSSGLHSHVLLLLVYMAVTKSKGSWKSGFLYFVTVTQPGFRSFNNKEKVKYIGTFLIVSIISPKNILFNVLQLIFHFNILSH